MLFTASTIKDSPENARFFAAANLSSGVDHMFIFLDAPKDPGQAEVASLLAAIPQVTCIPTDRRSWWCGDRPGSLNVRQRINANWARTVLEPFSWADWLFHIDGDEVAQLDRAVLDSVPNDVDSVRLEPLEAVSQWQPKARPTRFKRLLDKGELNLLCVLGNLGEPSNQHYFHGHVMGKSGVRPRSGLALTLHDAITPDGRRQEPYGDSRLSLLHYDAISGEEFTRKWNALAGAGKARYRPSRSATADALKSLITAELPEDVRAKYLRRIYELTTQDDVEMLEDLGLLVAANPEHGTSTPEALPGDAAERLQDRVEELRHSPKDLFFAAYEQKDKRGRASPRDHHRLRRLMGRS